MIAFTPRLAAALLLGAVLAVSLGGCALQEELERENAMLRQEILQLRQAISAASEGDEPVIVPLTQMRTFTVGLAASEKNFDPEAFLELLTASLKESSQSQEYKLVRESDSRQVSKIRGMLIQQYLAAQEVPITISNLTYKLEDTRQEFKIGDRVVPRDDIKITPAPSGQAIFASVETGIPAQMVSDGSGVYSVAYEVLGGSGGGGRIQIPVNDGELINSDRDRYSARQGDISFNWNVNLEQVVVYRIENFQGDIGQFARLMRYPTIRSAISQYQTLRDFVFLFGYGDYVTGLVQQIRTPSYISAVEVMPLSQESFDALRGGMTQSQVDELLTGGAWTPCTFVEFSRGERVWSRPPSVGFPFVSRQISGEKALVFYTKYDSEGALLIGDFESTSN